MLKFSFILLLVGVLVGCASLDKAFQKEVTVASSPSDPVDNCAGYLYPRDEAAVCSIRIPLALPSKFDLLGFQSKRTRTDVGEFVFIQPARITRTIVEREDGSAAILSGIVDEFLQAVWVNLPQGWCHGKLQAVVVGNDGNWIQTSDGRVFGALDVLWNTRALNDSIDVAALKNREYRNKFLAMDPSPVEIIPKTVRLTPQEKAWMDAAAKVAAKETTQIEPEQRIAQKTNFWLDILSVLNPYAIPVQGVSWVISAYWEANGKPHGFRVSRAITMAEVRSNAHFFHSLGERWRKGQFEKLG